MALKSHVLRDGLLELARNQPRDAPAAARRWAAMYGQYAADGRTALGGAPVSLAAAEATLTVALTAVFTGFGRPPHVVAQQFATALTAFWLLPPVVFAGGFPGVVTLVVGTPILGPALAAVWVANVTSRAPAQAAAERMATVIDTFTKTVTVTTATVPTPTVGTII